jgi:hypothetical protein
LSGAEGGCGGLQYCGGGSVSPGAIFELARSKLAYVTCTYGLGDFRWWCYRR